jgi:hypothetical protein
LPPQSNSLGYYSQCLKLYSRLPVSQKESNMLRGDDVVQMQNIKVLFIAGFGPIVPETTASRKLYSEILGISFQ